MEWSSIDPHLPHFPRNDMLCPVAYFPTFLSHSTYTGQTGCKGNAEVRRNEEASITIIPAIWETSFHGHSIDWTVKCFRIKTILKRYIYYHWTLLRMAAVLYIYITLPALVTARYCTSTIPNAQLRQLLFWLKLVYIFTCQDALLSPASTSEQHTSTLDVILVHCYAGSHISWAMWQYVTLNTLHLYCFWNVSIIQKRT